MSTPRARQLRESSTQTERALWAKLRSRQLKDAKFRRQVPVGPYIVDFICFDARLIVELDGGQHTVSIEADAERSDWLDSQGFRVIRFWNNDVLGNLEGVLTTIGIALDGG